MPARQEYCMKRLLAVVWVSAVIAVPAIAHTFTVGKLFIGHPWSRPAAAGMPVGVAYLSITNQGDIEDVLVSASTPAAASVEIHETTITDGMARMRLLKQVVIAPGKTVKIEPEGIHLMLVGLKRPIVEGKQVPLTLVFKVAGKLTVQLDVESHDAP
jgi:copper(I)-binding protein